MSDLSISNVNRNKFFRELGFIFNILRTIEEFAARFDQANGRTQVYVFNDNGQASNAASTSNWVLTGVKYGTNTAENGRVYVRITDGGGGTGHTVDLYKATGGGAGDKVATGTGNDGAKVTLAASNSSGLTGEVTLGTITANAGSNDDFYVHPVIDFPLRVPVLFDMSEDQHPAIAAALNSAIASTNNLATAILDLWRPRDGANVISVWEVFQATRGRRLFKSSAVNNFVDRESRDTSNTGTITTHFSGVLESMRDNMADNTAGAGAIKVLKNTVSAGAVSADGDNTGVGTIATPTVYEWARGGEVTVECSSDTVGSELFDVSQYVDAENVTIRDPVRLTVGKAYASPTLGIKTMTLVRTLALSGDDGDGTDFAAVSSIWEFTGVSPDNTDDGIVYLETEASGATYRINFYSAATRDVDTLVAITSYGAADATLSIQEQNGSGLGGTSKLGSAPADEDQAQINLQVFKTQNANGVPDKFTFTITETSRGRHQRAIADYAGYYLNSDTSGNQNVDEGYVTAGSFPLEPSVDDV